MNTVYKFLQLILKATKIVGLAFLWFVESAFAKQEVDTESQEDIDTYDYQKRCLTPGTPEHLLFHDPDLWPKDIYSDK